MSFFNKMKAGIQSVTNRVTGGYGEVSIEFDHQYYYPGQKVTARIVLSATESLKVTKISVGLAGLETVSFRDSDWEHNVDAACSHRSSTFQTQREVAGEFELPEGESREFPFEVELPMDLPPTCKAEHLKNVYSLKVDVDIPWGVDLHKTEEVTVLTRRRPPHVLSFKRTPEIGKSELRIKNAAVPGEELEFCFVLDPKESVLMKHLKVQLRSVVGFEAEMTRRIKEHNSQNNHQNHHTHHRSEHDQESHEVTEHVETHKEQIHVTLSEQSKTFGDNVRFSKKGVKVNGTITLPESSPVSYSRGLCEHKVVLEVTAVLSEREPIEFSEEISIYHPGRFKELGIEHSVSHFLNCVENNETETVKLFLNSGMECEQRIRATKTTFSGSFGEMLSHLSEQQKNPKGNNHAGGVIAHMAARHGAKENLELLLARGADKDAVDQVGEGLLHAAARGDSTEIIDILISQGVDLEAKAKDESTPLMAASREGKTKMIEHLLNKGADAEARNNLGHGPVHLAAGFGRTESVKFLLSKGFPIDEPMSKGMTPLWIAVSAGKDETVLALLEAGASSKTPTNEGDTPLHCAAKEGHLQLAQLLIRYGADVHASNPLTRKTPLHWAALFGTKEPVEYFLSHGADVNGQDATGKTPMHHAARAEETGLAECLLAAGADLSLRGQDGRLPLHEACEAGRIKVVEWLISLGTALEATDKSGMTPFHLTCQNGHLETAKLLLKNGVEKNPVNNQNQTPLSLAKKSRNSALGRFLSEVGCTEPEPAPAPGAATQPPGMQQGMYPPGQ